MGKKSPLFYIPIILMTSYTSLQSLNSYRTKQDKIRYGLRRNYIYYNPKNISIFMCY